MEFPGRSVLLEEQGDYVVWGQGVDHSWTAEDDSVVLTLRWPSVPGYAVPQEEERTNSQGRAAPGALTGSGPPEDEAFFARNGVSSNSGGNV